MEEITLLTIIRGEKDADGFPMKDEVKRTEVSGTELSVRISDQIAAERRNFSADIKLAVDIDDYREAIVGKQKPQKLLYEKETYAIKSVQKNLKTHEYEIICEVM